MEGFARGETWSKSSIGLWMQTVAMKEPDPDGALSFNLYEQQKVFDIRVSDLVRASNEERVSRAGST